MKNTAFFLMVLAMFALATVLADGAEPAFRIGIAQIAPHPALDAARKGFIDYLKDHGYRAGEKVTERLPNGSPRSLSKARLT